MEVESIGEVIAETTEAVTEATEVATELAEEVTEIATEIIEVCECIDYTEILMAIKDLLIMIYNQLEHIDTLLIIFLLFMVLRFLYKFVRLFI